MPVATSSSPRRRSARQAKPADDAVATYAREVIAGARPAGQRQVQACRRHLKDLEQQRTPAFPYYYDADLAGANIAFFVHLRHGKGREWAGQPFFLRPDQQFMIGSIFGWKRTSDDVRRFTRTYIQTPKKSGKSTTAGGVGIKLAFFDGEEGAEVYCASTKKEQSMIVFGTALEMVKRSPKLQARGLDWLRTIIRQPSTNSRLEPLGADEHTMDGINPSGAIIDELHAHKTRGVVEQIEESMGTRAQPLAFTITTPGFDRQSICFERYQYACSILDGTVVDDTFFVFITDPDEGDVDNWDDPKVWAKANLGLGEVGLWLWRGVSLEECQRKLDAMRRRALKETNGLPREADSLVAQKIGSTVKLRDLVTRAHQAKASPAAQNTFKRFRLGMWTEQSVRAIDMAQWDLCAGERTWKELLETLHGRTAFGGVDLASTQDIVAVAWLLETDVKDTYDLVPELFLPEDRLASRQERERLKAFAAAGALTLTPGNVIDYQVIRKRMRERADELRVVRDVGYDPWNATQFSLEARDQDGFDMVEVRQGMLSMGEPTKKLLNTLIPARRIRHGGHPALRWMASNLAVRTDHNGNMMPDKARSAEKIDGLVASIIALACAIRSKGPARKKSPYATRGAVVVTAAGARPLIPPPGEPRS